MSRSFALAGLVVLCAVGSCGSSGTVPPSARAQAAPATVEGLWTYTDAHGGLHILGEVVNAAPWALGHVSVIMRVQARDGKVLAERKVRPLVPTLDVGGESPFAAKIGGVADPSAVLAVAVSATPVPSHENPLRVTNRRVRTADDRAISTGRVCNVSHTAALAEVVAAFRDVAGHVVGIRFGYLSFPPGETPRTRPFKFEIRGRNIGGVDVAVTPGQTSGMRLKAELVGAVHSTTNGR